MRVSKVVLIGSVPPLVLQTPENPTGTPIEVLDGFRQAVIADRSQFFKDLAISYFGADRPGANISEALLDSCWHTGRSSHLEMTGGETPVSASVDPAYWQNPEHLVSSQSGWVQPSPHRALSISEIAGIVEDYRRAAERAKAAGFDGVELHSANGYLPDQFLQDGSNKRTDEYGGSIQNRSRFLLEIVGAMASVWGGDRIADRAAPGMACRTAIRRHSSPTSPSN